MGVILWFCAILAAGLYICGPLADPDLWWHVTVGRWIIAHGSLPYHDYWNMFAVGRPWRAYSWSSEILYALADTKFGIHGLLTLQIALVSLLALTFAYCFSRMAQDYFFGTLLGIYTTLSVFNHFTLRPQALVWLLFLLLIYATDRVMFEGFSNGKKLSLFSIMVIWANTHVTAVLGIIAVVVWLFNKKHPQLSAQAVLILLLGTLVTPYFGGEWLSLFEQAGDPIRYAGISEFQPAHVMQYSTVFFILLGIVFFVFHHHRPRTLEPSKLVGLAIFSLAGLSFVKFLPFANIYLASLLANFWRRESKNIYAFGNLGEAFVKLRDLVVKIPKEGLSFVLICSMIVNLYQLWSAPVATNFVPVAAVDFFQANNLKHPILNVFGDGGYLIYRFSDAAGNLEHKVAIDGRTNVTPAEVMESHSLALSGAAGWEGYLNLVKPETILWRADAPLVSILLAGGEWCEVFSSGSGEYAHVILVKREESVRFKDARCGA